MTRDHFLIHFVRRGRGTFRTGGRTRQVAGGQCFLIFPDTPAQYRADDEFPWSYSWIGFTGPALAETLKGWGLTPDAPVLSFDDTCRAFYYMEEIMESRWDIPGTEWRVIGNLLKILGELERFACSGRQADQDSHVQKALKYMDRNYTRPIGVADIVDHVCLERSYFSRLFREKTGETLRDYLHRYRMDKAMELLLATSYSIEIVARSVGFRDPLHFSRNFKKQTGYSPSEYRKKGTG